MAGPRDEEAGGVGTNTPPNVAEEQQPLLPPEGGVVGREAQQPSQPRRTCRFPSLAVLVFLLSQGAVQGGALLANRYVPPPDNFGAMIAIEFWGALLTACLVYLLYKRGQTNIPCPPCLRPAP